MTPRERLPHQLRALSAHDWTEITIGKSHAAVWRIVMGGSALFLKAEPAHDLNGLAGEVLRLDYLAEMGFPAPRIVDHVDAHDFHWLLMTEVPGHDLTHLEGEPDILCRALAGGLKRLHALEPANCPFDHKLDRKLEAAERNLLAGLVDETDFDAARLGMTGQQVFDWVAANRPKEDDLVVTHGDACLPNILAHEGRFSGVVDCSRLGVADRWQDLALACRSLAANGGKDLMPMFLDAYGVAFDAERYAYYCTLDELF